MRSFGRPASVPLPLILPPVVTGYVLLLLFGRKVPMMVMSHQYILFEEIPELAAWTKEVGHKLPLLRDVDTSYYLRQEKYGMNLGPYERNCRAHWVGHNDPMPEDFSFQLFPDDLDRLEWYLNDATARVPILATAGLSKVINGPIPYAPDGNPLIGPMPGVPNAAERAGAPVPRSRDDALPHTDRARRRIGRLVGDHQGRGRARSPSRGRNRGRLMEPSRHRPRPLTPGACSRGLER